MNFFCRLGARHLVYLIAACLLPFAPLLAQTPPGSLRGQVVDPSGAAVSGATVLVVPAEGPSITTTTGRDGAFEVKTLLPGTYTIQVFATGFAEFENKNVQVVAGSAAVVNVHLTIEVQKEKVEVQETSTALDVGSSNNANSIVLKGKDLDSLSDDPDELQEELTALAGPSAGPNGGQIYIDGFTAGQLPPKSSIREIRINQNPFSAEYDQLGYGRIEILTKPGTDKLHGQFMVNGSDSALNSRNPFIGRAVQPAYHSVFFNGNIGGSFNKKTSFFFSMDRRHIDEISVINTPALDANFNQIQFTQGVPNPRTRTNLGPRLDYQLSSTNTLTVRYQYWRENEENNGIGQYSLPTQAFNQLNTEHTVQISDTQTLSEHIINETRFQYVRSNSSETSLNTTPTISVGGAFTGGGNNLGILNQTIGGYEIQNYTSIAAGKHFVKFGVRSRIDRDSSDKTQAFNGLFIFNSLAAYQTTAQGLATGMTWAQIRAAGGGPSQFSLVTGTPLVQNNYAYLGPYVQDEWRVRPNVTLSYGLRYEWQNQIGSSGSVAPRLGVAWGIGKTKQGSPKAVLRGGYGIFYSRLRQQNIEQALLDNGISQQHLVISWNPPAPGCTDFYPNLPTPAQLASCAQQSSPTIYQVDPNWKTPYVMQSGVTLEKQLGKSANVAVTYLNTRGVHALLTRNINAPLPPTYLNTDRPLGGQNNIYQYEPAGLFKQNQFIVNGSVRMGSKLSLFSYYTLNYARSNTSGIGSFPSNQYDLTADRGRAGYDTRHRVFLGGSIGLPHMFRISPFMVASSGAPFNVTSGVDSNNDSLFTDRPTYSQFQTALANAQAKGTLASGVSFHCQPAAGQTEIPVNCGQGPARFSLNLRLSKTFGFGQKTQSKTAAGGPMGGGTFGRGPGGPERGGGGRGGGMFGEGNSGYRYNLTFAISARNAFNHVNVGNPSGVITSPIFGQANSLAGGPFGSAASNRRIELQTMFSF